MVYLAREIGTSDRWRVEVDPRTTMRTGQRGIGVSTRVYQTFSCWKSLYCILRPVSPSSLLSKGLHIFEGWLDGLGRHEWLMDACPQSCLSDQSIVSWFNIASACYYGAAGRPAYWFLLYILILLPSRKSRFSLNSISPTYHSFTDPSEENTHSFETLASTQRYPPSCLPRILRSGGHTRLFRVQRNGFDLYSSSFLFSLSCFLN